MLIIQGDMFAIIVVYLYINFTFELPPRESFKKKVSFESLNGTYFPLHSLLLFSTRAFITLPSVDSDLYQEFDYLLIIPASLSLSPIVPVLFCRSDPAKSIKCSLEFLVFTNPPSTCVLKFRKIVKIK